MSVLDVYYREAVAALNRGDMALHMAWGRIYHRAADRIAAETGVDPRPSC